MLPIDYPKPGEKHIFSLCEHKGTIIIAICLLIIGSGKPGAGDGDRTRDFLLGKEMLYH